MANPIKDTFGASTLMEVSLDALPSSTGGAGKQTTLVNNTTTRYPWVRVFYKIVQGTNPTSAKGVYFHLLRKDNNATPHIDDNAGANDANHTVVNALRVETGLNKSSGAATGEFIMGSFVLSGDNSPGDYWGLSINHDTVANLGTGNYVRYAGGYNEIQ